MKRPKLEFNPIEKHTSREDKQSEVDIYYITIKNKGKSGAENCTLEIKFNGEGEAPQGTGVPFFGRCKVKIEGKLSKPVIINQDGDVSFEFLKVIPDFGQDENENMVYLPFNTDIQFPSETGSNMPIRWYNEKKMEYTVDNLDKTTFFSSIRWKERIIILTSQNTKKISKKVDIEEEGRELKIKII